MNGHAEQVGAEPGESTHPCGHPGRRGRCRHRVRDASGHRYCEDHRHGWRERWAQLAGQVPTAAPPARHRARSPSSTGPDGAGRQDGGADRRVDVAVAEVRRIAGVAWRYRAERLAIAAVGADVHRRARSTRNCHAIAALADDLEQGRKAALRVVSGLLNPLVPPAGARASARLVARLFVQHMAAGQGAQVDAVVVVLRAYGVLLCLLADRDLRRCRCLRAVTSSEVDEHVRAEVRAVVGHGFDRLDHSSRPAR